MSIHAYPCILHSYFSSLSSSSSKCFWVFCATEAVVEYLKENPSAVADFDYRKENPRAPQHWGDLKKEWSTCKYGKKQSPIAIWEKNATKVVTSLKDLVVNYKPANATIKNEEHAISVRNTNSYLIVYV